MDINDVKITIVKRPTNEDWALVKRATLATVGKKPKDPPSEQWKRKLLAAGHSPIRILNFYVEFENLPSYISVHLVRHVHAQPFVKSQRNDRQKEYDRKKAPQDTPVTMGWFFNAEELITIAHKRLCGQADPDTRKLIRRMCDLILDGNPEFEGLLVPLCEYRGGVCTEFFPCGYNKILNRNKECSDNA